MGRSGGGSGKNVSPPLLNVPRRRERWGNIGMVAPKSNRWAWGYGDVFVFVKRKLEQMYVKHGEAL